VRALHSQKGSKNTRLELDDRRPVLELFLDGVRDRLRRLAGLARHLEDLVEQVD
jgi:hypothetical protein